MLSKVSKCAVVCAAVLVLGIVGAMVSGMGSMQPSLPPGQGYEKLLTVDATEDGFQWDEGFGGSPLRGEKRTSVGRFRGARIVFLGDIAADNAGAEYRVYAITPVRGAQRAEISVRSVLLCSGTLTFSSAASPPANFDELGMDLNDGWRFADTITVEVASGETDPKGMGAALFAADGDAQAITAYSPENGTAGELIIPDAFDADSVYVELIVGANCARVNGLICPLR